MTQDVRITHYVPGEGRRHMENCLAAAVARCSELSLTKLVVFTGTGEGPMYALRALLPQDDYSGIEMVAVTPPVGRPYRLDPRDSTSPIVQAGIASEVRAFLTGAGVPVVSAHLPFKPIGGRSSPSADMTEIGEVLAILGGGFALCVQAVLMACDAGEVAMGERVVAATADTAIVVIATRTETFLSKRVGLLVEEIICRPAVFDISKAGHTYVHKMSESLEHDSAELDALDVPVASLEAPAVIADLVEGSDHADASVPGGGEGHDEP